LNLAGLKLSGKRHPACIRCQFLLGPKPAPLAFEAVSNLGYCYPVVQRDINTFNTLPNSIRVPVMEDRDDVIDCDEPE
jgi:hypothetical protein